MGWIETLKQAAQGPGRKGLSSAQKKETARELVQMSGLAAAAVTLAPLPIVDLLAITPIQAAMVMAVGRVHGREVDLKEAKSILVELASVCGTGLLAQKVFATATKLFLPGLGGVLSAPYAFAVTWAMGQVAIGYFDEEGGAREKLKQIFDDALAEGKRIFSRDAVEAFRRQRGAEVEDFARRQTQRAPSPTDKPKPAPRAKSSRAAPKKRTAAAKSKAKPAARKTKRPTRPAP